MRLAVTATLIHM